MLSQVRRGHHHEFDGDPMSARAISNYGEHWKPSDRANSTILNTTLLPDPFTARSHSSALSPDLSRAFHIDAQLLAIVRIEDKRNSFYSTEVVLKLRQKEQAQKFINKPCSLFVTDRHFVIYDRTTQAVAEKIPLENVDPTCVYSEEQDTLNDIFMYRIMDRRLGTMMTNQMANSQNIHDLSHAIVFKCSNKESQLLVDKIHVANGRVPKGFRGVRPEPMPVVDKHFIDPSRSTYYPPPQPVHEPVIMNPNPTHVPVGPQRPPSQHQSKLATIDYYKRLTEELNKCFDDIEAFIRYMEKSMEYTKEFERDHRRKDKKSTRGQKQMLEKLPDDRFFVDILQKLKHSFNLLGELKAIIHSPTAPELVHYLLSPLQFILYTLHTRHPNQLQLAQDVWSPAITREAKELLNNCVTTKEHDILWNLGPAWVRTAEEIPQKIHDYRPVFFEGRAVWLPEPPNDYSAQSPRSTDERQSSTWSSPRQLNQNNNNQTASKDKKSKTVRQISPTRQFDTSTVDRSTKSNLIDNFNTQMQTEQVWAIEKKRAGAKICLVKCDRQGQNGRELTVRRGELVEIEDHSRNWWRARNFRGQVGHVPNNILEDVDLEQISSKGADLNTSAFIPRSSSAPNRRLPRVNGHQQYATDEYPQQLLRSPSYGNNFIMQSNNSTITSPIIMRDQSAQVPFPPSVSSPDSNAAPPPPPPLIPMLLLNSPVSTWSRTQQSDSSRRERSRSHTNDSIPRVDVLQQELTQRIADRVGFISSSSSKEEVQRWLASKHISPELAQHLSDMNGEDLFQLTKTKLDQYTNEQEATRLFTLLLQQKQLAGVRTAQSSEKSPRFNMSAANGSLKTNTINNTDDNPFGPDDTLTRSLKIKLKQRRDKIEQATTVDPADL